MTSTQNNSRLHRARGALLGLAVGDAVGTTVEFKSRGTFEPLTDLVGGGPFGLTAGQFTDDTSMALCLGAASGSANASAQSSTAAPPGRTGSGWRVPSQLCQAAGRLPSAVLAAGSKASL